MKTMSDAAHSVQSRDRKEAGRGADTLQAVQPKCTRSLTVAALCAAAADCCVRFMNYWG